MDVSSSSMDSPDAMFSPCTPSPTSTPSSAQLTKPFMLEQATTILGQADKQLKEGKITREAHQEIIKQLAELYRLQKLKHELIKEREGLSAPDAHLLSEEDFRVGLFYVLKYMAILVILRRFSVLTRGQGDLKMSTPCPSRVISQMCLDRFCSNLIQS